MTMGRSWAYNPAETAWKSPDDLLHNLVRVVSRGGNYLLNVGPTSRGVFPPEAVERLQAVGKWMKTCSKAIYGNTYTPLQGQPWGQVTRKDDKVYLHVIEWPSNGTLVIDPFPGKAQAVSLFSGKPLKYGQQAQCLEITLPPQAPGSDGSVLTVEIDPAEKGWSAYSAPAVLTTEPEKYIGKQAILSGIINLVLNGLLAFFTYHLRLNVPAAETVWDIPITVFILVFLVGWLSIDPPRKEFAKGNLARHPTSRRGMKLPKNSALRALVLTIPAVPIWGILILDSLVNRLFPGGFSGLGYFVFKSLYTGVTAALASALAIQTVVADENRMQE